MKIETIDDLIKVIEDCTECLAKEYFNFDRISYKSQKISSALFEILLSAKELKSNMEETCNVNNCVIIGNHAGNNLTRATNCTLIGHYAGSDLTQCDGVVIIGDYINNLDPDNNVLTLFDRIAIGKTLFGVPIN